MNKLLVALSLALASTITYADASKKEEKPPVQAQKKPEVKKPCKEGQNPEKDNCHELKKVEPKKK